MQKCTNFERMRRAGWLSAAALAGVFAVVAPMQAQHPDVPKGKVAPQGDTLATPGPLATDLSPKLDKKDLAKAMKIVADWQLGRLPAEPQTDWTFAAMYAGFMGVPDKVAGDKYKVAMQKIGDGLDWQPGPRVMHADDQAIGQMYLEQYMIHKDPKMLAGIKAHLDAEMAAPDDPKKPLWWWCDALFMAPPVLARMSAMTGDRRYLETMDREWWQTSASLYDPAEHLYYRDSRYFTQRQANGQKVFWARGNGWVMGAFAKVLGEMPKDDPSRPKYLAQYREMADRIASIQGKDGLWRSGLLDPDAYDLPEVSGSAFFTYSLAWGINHGILDRAKFEPVVERAWAGMLTHIYADGRLGSIQPIDGQPGKFKPSASYVYGVGGFLLAASEVDQMARKR